MAQPLKYTPPKAHAEQTAEEEWKDLLETLHASGTLRVLNGLAGQCEGVEEVLLTQLVDTPRGHRTVKNLAALFNGFSDLDPYALEAAQDGVGAGVKAARRRLSEEKPPGLLRLFARLRDPDVRRALSALLALLKAAGGRLNASLEAPAERGRGG